MVNNPYGHKHIYTEQYDDLVLIKIRRNNKMIAGITARGVVVQIKDEIDSLTDNELSELMDFRTSIKSDAATHDEVKTLHDLAVNANAVTGSG